MPHAIRSRSGPRLVLAVLMFASIAASQRDAHAQFIEAASTAIDVVQKLYSGYQWESCFVGNVCPESDAHKAATTTINSIETTIYKDVWADLKTCSDALLTESQDDYGDPSKLTPDEEGLLRDNAQTCFDAYYNHISVLSPTDPNASEFAYEIAPAFNITAALVDNILRTARLRGVVNVLASQISDDRAKTQEINYSLIGSKSVWYQCPGNGARVMVRTTSNYDQADNDTWLSGHAPFTTKKLWMKFANYGFSYDECMNNCNVFNLATGPAASMCYTSYPGYCLGGLICGCSGDNSGGDSDAPTQTLAGSGQGLAFNHELPKILAKMDSDVNVAIIRGSMKTLAGLSDAYTPQGLKSVDEPYCGVPTGQLGSELEVASSVVALNGNGNYVVVDTRTDGTLYQNRQVTTDRTWSGESTIGGAARQTAMALSRGQWLTLFYIGLDGALYRKTQYSDFWEPDGVWRDAIPFGWSAEQIAVSHDADGRLDLFYVGLATNSYNQVRPGIFHTWQVPVPGCPLCDSTWSGQLPVASSDIYTYRKPLNDAKRIAVAPNQDGTLEVFYTLRSLDGSSSPDDNAIYHVHQTAPNTDSWTAPAALGGHAKEITVNSNFDGGLEVFYIGLDGGFYHNYQSVPNGAWSGEQNTYGAGKQIAVGRDSGATLDLFGIGTDDRIYHNGSYGNWSFLAGTGPTSRHVAIGDGGDLRTIYAGLDNGLYEAWRDSGAWSGPFKLYSAPPPSQVLSQAALYRDTSTMLNNGGDWLWGYGKANCANGWRITGLAARDSIGDVALCVGPSPNLFTGTITATLTYTGYDQRRANRVAGTKTASVFDTSTDWDYPYVKHECGYGEYVAGIAEGASFIGGNNKFQAIQCGVAGAVAGPLSENACTTRTLFPNQDDRASVYEGDWDVGAIKAECDVDQHLAGVSVDGSGNIHRLLCCNNNP